MPLIIKIDRAGTGTRPYNDIRKMIAIIDYGTGNLRSVAKAFEFLGHQVIVTSDPEEIDKCDKLVLPGVGAFGDCMSYLKKGGLDLLVLGWIESGRPYLGICLGMQILFERSSEMGEHEGLGIIKGDVVRFSGNVKVPQIGWNMVNFNDRAAFQAKDGYYYFVHSYYCRPQDTSVVLAQTNYGGDYCSAIVKDNVLAVQFHPEKSSSIGLDLLDKFARGYK